MDRECLKGVKVVYQEHCYVLQNIPSSFATLGEALETVLDLRLSSVRCYGVSVRGEFLIKDEDDFREFARICPELNCFELEDPYPKVAVPIRITSLVGMRCLHQHCFKLQSFSLETYRTESTSVKLLAGFAFVFIDNGLFITGGSGEQCRMASVFRDDQLTPHSNLLSDHCSHLSLVLDQAVFVIGGMDTRMNFSKECEVYAYPAKSWKKLPRLNVAVQFPTGCIMNGKVFVLTGKEIEVLTESAWESLAVVLPDGFKAASLTQVRENSLLIFGGIGSDRAVELNLNSGAMTDVASVPVKSKYFMHPLRKYRGSVYAWGPNLESIFSYNINMQRWSKVSLEFWEKRVGLVVTYDKGKHSFAFTNLWKLPLGLIREICGTYL